jgi:hypothetical protein
METAKSHDKEFRHQEDFLQSQLQLRSGSKLAAVRSRLLAPELPVLLGETVKESHFLGLPSEELECLQNEILSDVGHSPDQHHPQINSSHREVFQNNSEHIDDCDWNHSCTASIHLLQTMNDL